MMVSGLVRRPNSMGWAVAGNRRWVAALVVVALLALEGWLLFRLPVLVAVQVLGCGLLVWVAVRRKRRWIRRMREIRGAPDWERFQRALGGTDEHGVGQAVYQALMTWSRAGGQVQILPDDDLELIHGEDPSEIPSLVANLLERFGIEGGPTSKKQALGGVRTPREIVLAIERQLGSNRIG